MVFDPREEEGCQSDRLVPDIDSKLSAPTTMQGVAKSTRGW